MTLDLLFVMAGWFAMAIAFFFRGFHRSAAVRRRDRLSLAGLLLQGAGFVLVQGGRRPMHVVVGGTIRASGARTVLIGGLVLFSVWLVAAAARALGKQWSLTARLVEGHELITAGPYRLVRHPIYTGLLGMLVATGLAQAHWVALVAGVAVYVLGTWLRTSREERLLREQFGETYERYARAVPGLIPFLRLRSGEP